MDLKLEDAVVIVTGGTGDIGCEIVARFIEEGARVVFTFVRKDEKAREMMDRFGAKQCVACKVSVLEQDGLERMVEETVDRWGKIDVLVNNAAVAQVLPFPLIEEEDFSRLMDVNLKGPFLVTRSAARNMVLNRSGVIINVGSLAGERIMEVPVHYATSKSGLSGFTYSLARELGRYNIRVNGVAPGLIDGGVGRNVPEKQRNQYTSFCSLGRLGQPGEVADVIVFLASSRCSYINGQMVFIDGGI